MGAAGWEHDDGAIGSSTTAVGVASASEWISTGWEHDDAGAMGSSTAAVGSASMSERILTGWEHSSTAAVGGASSSERISTGGEHDDGAVGCCFARRERWEGCFDTEVGVKRLQNVIEVECEGSMTEQESSSS